jgi:hypothetical protein
MSAMMNGCYFASLNQTMDGSRPINVLQTVLDQIPGSLTTDYILFSFSVPDANSIIYTSPQGGVVVQDGKINDTYFDVLSQVVNAGRNEGALSKVWLTLGAAGDTTFETMTKIIQQGGTALKQLEQNFTKLYEILGAYGFDIDYENNPYRMNDVVAPVIVWLYNTFKCRFTACPYETSTAWGELLAKVYSELGTQPFAGINLQTYCGGASNNPNTWAEDLNNIPGTGISDFSQLIWPIQSITEADPPGYGPEGIKNNLSNWDSYGGSWRNTYFLTKPDTGTITDFSEAISEGCK